MDQSDDDSVPTAVTAPAVPVLDYAHPGPSRIVRWLTRPVSPEIGLVVWGLVALAIGIADRRDLAMVLVYCGLDWFAVVRLFRWRATWLWKLQAAAACVTLFVGLFHFLAPWAHEDYRADFWWLYNQTYAWTYRESLRVAWIPALGLAWFFLAIAGAWLQNARHRPPSINE